MTPRLSYADSCHALQSQQLIDEGEIPLQPEQSPRHDDEVLGVSFFRTELANAKLEHLTLPRTFFNRSEIRATSFLDSDLSESTANWNDFIDVDFSSADLSRCDFRACIFQSTRFVGAYLVSADFRHCSFLGCDFTGADLTGAKFTKEAAESLQLSSEHQRFIDWQADDGNEPEGG
jgi:BTB/POZ domain-containing protein KCTD9